MYTDFRDQNGNPVAASVVLEAIKNPIIKHSVSVGITENEGGAPIIFFTEEGIIRNSLIFTNSCASDGIKLGSVNIGMAKMTVSNEKFKSFREASVLIDKLISPIFYLEIDDNTRVTVMGGDYWIKEVEQLTEGVRFTCYDSMCKLDEPFTLGTVTGTPYQIFTQAATACGLTVSTTQAEMEALPNGTRTFTLHSDNDCKTWRDVLSYLSMLMGCFVTIGRHVYQVAALPGIEVRPFGNGKESFCDTVTDVHRYKGAKFSIFDTEYKAIELTAYAVDGEDTIKKDFTYAETTGVTGQTIKLGYNPFIQADTPEADLTQTQRDILHELLTQVDKYAYTPMQISLPVGFIYDLGDVIKCTGGLANTDFAGGYTEDCYCCISNYTYTYGKEFRIKTLDSHAGKGRAILSPTIPISELPARWLTYVKDPNTTYNGQPILWNILEHGHDGDPEGSTTLQTKDIITLKCFDAKEPNSSNSQRKNYGNNSYRLSNLFQWLNSSASAGSWFSKKHSQDTPPSSAYVYELNGIAINPYDTEAGFLTNFSSEFLAAIQPATKVCAWKNGTAEPEWYNITSKVFLLSLAEIAPSNEIIFNTLPREGSQYEFFQNSSWHMYIVKALANEAAKGNYDAVSGKWWSWFLRSCNPANWAGVIKVDSSEIELSTTISYTYAYLGYHGVAPALCIPSTTQVLRTPDTDGAYIIQF